VRSDVHISRLAGERGVDLFYVAQVLVLSILATLRDHLAWSRIAESSASVRVPRSMLPAAKAARVSNSSGGEGDFLHGQLRREPAAL
jgi:hypothetical protein